MQALAGSGVSWVPDFGAADQQQKAVEEVAEAEGAGGGDAEVNQGAASVPEVNQSTEVVEEQRAAAGRGGATAF